MHLSDDKRDEIKASIESSDAVPNVVIYNWPADREPCTRAEMYRTFQATKPPYQEEVDETFSLFIDQDSSGDYCILLVRETISAGTPLFLSTLRDVEDASRFWHAVWHPFEHGRRGTQCDSVRVNTTLFDGPLRSRSVPIEVVPCPDHFDFSGADNDYCCFILSPMTETQFRHVRQKLFSWVEDRMQFINVSKLVPTPDIPGLMTFFESDQYVQSGQDELPNFFLAIDDKTLKGVEDKDTMVDEDTMGLVLVAERAGLSVQVCDTDNKPFASWAPGYGYCRLDAYRAVNTCTGLSVCNISFSEWCDEPEFSCWSGFQGWKDANEDKFINELGQIQLAAMCRDLGDLSA